MPWSLVLALLLLPGFAAAKAGEAAHLERMQIEIWPEYDRPAALVILKGELAADVKLPVTVSLRIPGSSGGPGAVAFAAEKTGPLLNLPHDRSAAGGTLTLRFSLPERFFHVEFYDPLATGTHERAYQYVWPGDLPVDALQVVVQEPAASTGFSVRPELDGRSTGSDGLRYRTADLGAAAQGKAVPIEIRYAKSDPRTSLQILEQKAAAAPSGTSPEERDAFRLFMATAAFALLVAGVGLFVWWRLRARPSGGDEPGLRRCAQCGNALAAGDRFCSKCGAALA